MTNTEQDATSPKSTTPAKKPRSKVYCKSYRRKLNSCTSWSQANKKGFCVRCFDEGWPAILDQINDQQKILAVQNHDPPPAILRADLDQIHTQTKPSASHLPLNKTSTPREDTCTEIFNQGVTTLPAEGLLALQNYDSHPSEAYFNEGTQINSINVSSQETDERIKIIEEQVRQNNDIIETLQNEVINMERKIKKLQKDVNFAELFNSDISDIDDNNETATNNNDQNENNDVNINYIDDIERINNVYNGTGVCIASSCKADPSHKCFSLTKEKLCAHTIDHFMLNDVGDYVMFPSNCFHRGYFSIQKDSIYYTAQMFATPSENTSEETRTRSRNATIMKNLEGKGTMQCVQLTELSKDILENWTNEKYQRIDFKPPKKFDGQYIDSSQHRHVFRTQFSLLKQLDAFVRYVEDLHTHITVDSIWIMAKSKTNNGFQRWHKDFELGTKITTTIVINVGVQT